LGGAGEQAGAARLAVILLHGRGAGAEDILLLAEELEAPEAAFLAPQAAGSTWYPFPFLVPAAHNEPWLSSAIETVRGCLQQAQAAGIPAERTVLLGFSQGACLALEYTARNPRRYGAVVGLSGGLIGSETEVERLATAPEGALDGTPVFMGCSDVDPHIPAERFLRSSQILERMGARVTARLYPGMGHTVNADELGEVNRMIRLLAGASSPQA
jgi:predicted esterase